MVSGLKKEAVKYRRPPTAGLDESPFMKLEIVKIGNPLLRKKTRALSRSQLKLKKLQTFLKGMTRAMRHAQGVGLAANQIGLSMRAFVMECRGNRRYPRVDSFPLQAYLNPKIVRYSKAKEGGWEGCLSIPGFRGKVSRSKQVTLAAITSDGRRIQKTFRGFEARVLQHEVDHLNGFFYMDRMDSLKTWTHLEEFNQRFKYEVKDKK